MAKSVSVERIAPSELNIDHQYQRPLVEDHVRKIVREFNRDFIGVLIVAKRDSGTHYVLDGQHRLEAINRMGLTSPIPCLVYQGLAVAEEADIFSSQQNSKRIHPIDFFKARCFAGDPVTTAIAGILTEFDLEMAISRGSNSVGCPGELEKIYGEVGKSGLERVLKLSTSVYHDDRHALPRTVIGGVHAFLIRYGKLVDDDRFIDVISRVPKGQIDSTAMSMRQFLTDRGSVLYGRTFHHFYNGKMRGVNRLPDWDDVTRELYPATAASREAVKRERGGEAMVAVRPLREATA